jgi:hypothetical protein
MIHLPGTLRSISISTSQAPVGTRLIRPVLMGSPARPQVGLLFARPAHRLVDQPFFAATSALAAALILAR